MSWYIIINPVSAQGKSVRTWNAVKRALDHRSISFTADFSEYPGHTVELAEYAVKKGFRTLVCLGGDGTLHEVVNGVMRSPVKQRDEIQIGIIPVGTGNDWARGYCIPKDYKKAIEIIQNGRVITQDIGRIITAEKVVYFNNSAGIGFDGFVVKNMNRLKSWGKIAYLLAAIKSIFKYKRFPLEFHLNSEVYKATSLILIAGICRYSGGGMQLTNDPDPNDRLLDITHIEYIRIYELFVHIFNLFNGKLASRRFAQSFKGGSVRILTKDNENGIIQADGELIGVGSCEIGIDPSRLKFIVP
jgi:YegS/Rv2252/BmrU family lipid kinase